MPLDQTDFEILSLLADDARRSYSDIADRVDLSGPAVSDRVDKLESSGLIEGYTVKIDRERLKAGVPVFVTVHSPTSVEDLKARLAATESVEGVFTTADGTVRFTGRVAAESVREWVAGLVDSTFEVELLDSASWSPSVTGDGFAIACAECGNAVTEEGESVRLDGDVYHFCCSSCRGRFEDRYETLAAGQ